jgi:hypothetical protein
MGWIIGLLVIGFLTAWFTLRPALLNKNLAFTGNQQILAIQNRSQNGNLPDTGTMTLLDQINLIGLATIFLCLIQTVISSRFAVKGEQEFSLKFDRASFPIISFIYIAINIALPLAAQIR